jgi:hypothetical protein
MKVFRSFYSAPPGFYVNPVCAPAPARKLPLVSHRVPS